MSDDSTAKYISIEDYLAAEETADVKHEYYQGEVFAMAGGSIAHNRIVRNVLSSLDGFYGIKDAKFFQAI